LTVEINNDLFELITFLDEGVPNWVNLNIVLAWLDDISFYFRNAGVAVCTVL
jgi:hypothetical protein